MAVDLHCSHFRNYYKRMARAQPSCLQSREYRNNVNYLTSTYHNLITKETIQLFSSLPVFIYMIFTITTQTNL